MPVSCSVSQSVPSGMYFINSPAIIVAGGLQYKRMVGSDANLDEITEYGTYIVQAGHRVFINGCILYVFKIERYIHHIAFDITGSYILTRFKGYSGYWYKWMKINLYISA